MRKAGQEGWELGRLGGKEAENEGESSLSNISSDDLVGVEETLDAVHLNEGSGEDDYKFGCCEFEHFLLVVLLPLDEAPLPFVHPVSAAVGHLHLLVDGFQLGGGNRKVVVICHDIGVDAEPSALQTHFHHHIDCMAVADLHYLVAAFKFELQYLRDMDCPHLGEALRQIISGFHEEELVLVRVGDVGEIVASLLSVGGQHDLQLLFVEVRNPSKLVRSSHRQFEDYAFCLRKILQLLQMLQLFEKPGVNLCSHCFLNVLLLFLLQLLFVDHRGIRQFDLDWALNLGRVLRQDKANEQTQKEGSVHFCDIMCMKAMIFAIALRVLNLNPKKVIASRLTFQTHSQLIITGFPKDTADQVVIFISFLAIRLTIMPGIVGFRGKQTTSQNKSFNYSIHDSVLLKSSIKQNKGSAFPLQLSLFPCDCFLLKVKDLILFFWQTKHEGNNKKLLTLFI